MTGRVVGGWATEAALFYVREAWSRGDSAAQIARALDASPMAGGLGVSKNCIIGMVRRLALVRAEGVPAQASRRKAIRPRVRRPIVAPPPPPPPPPPKRPGFTCLFPIGERRPFTACGAPALDRQPYCKKHAAVVYAPPRHIGASPAQEND